MQFLQNEIIYKEVAHTYRMLLKHPIRALILLALLFLSYQLHAQIPQFKQHPLSIEGIDALKPTKIIESKNGYLWFATPKGIVRYNGSEPILFKTEHAVTAIFEGHNHQIWAGLDNGNILQLIGNQFNKWVFADSLPQVPIVGFAEDAAQNLWIATYGKGVYVYDKKNLTHSNRDNGLLGDDIYCIASDSDGKIWLGTDVGINICSYKNGKTYLEKLTKTEGLPDDIVGSIVFDNRQNAWVGLFDAGLCRYNVPTKTLQHITPNWQNGVIEALDAKGETVWIGTENKGLFTYSFTSNAVKSFVFPNEKIYAIHNDIEGNTWILSQKNGVQSTNRRFNSQTVALQNIQCVLSTQDETIYLGTKDGLYFKKKGGANFEKMSLGKRNIVSLFQDFMGNIWIGTYGEGLFCLKKSNQTILHFTEKDGLSNGSIFSIDGKDDVIWLATLGGVTALNLSNFNAGRKDLFTVRNTSNGLSTDFIYKVFIDSKNRAWFGTDGKGVSCLENEALKNYEYLKKDTLEGVYAITEDGTGHIWIATSNNKLYTFDNQTFKPYPLPTNQLNRKILGLTTDSKGNIVLSCMGGISILNPVTHQFLNFDKELIVNKFEPSLNAFSKTEQGGILLASQSDLVEYNAFYDNIATKPRLILRGVSIFMQPVDFEKNNQFAYNQNYLTFAYEGLWLTQPDKVYYRYKLEGLDPNWQYSKERQITYANLPSGNFTMHIQAALDDNFDQFIEVTYRFSIKQAFWKQWWFILLLLGISASIIYFFIKTREKRLQHEATLKREKVEAELDMLKSQINPHFLFNSFNTLIATIEDNPENAVEYVERLSTFFRSILQVREKAVITVQEELDLLDNFIFLLKKRHGDNIHFDINLRIKNNFIVPLTLQMLLENAVKHNVVSKSRPLSIFITEIDDYIEVKNNLQPKTDSEPSTHFGLTSIRSQYANLTHTPVLVREIGNYFMVLIPILKNESI